MASATVKEIVRQAETLEPEEQLRLIALLAEKVQRAYYRTSPRRRWRDVCGAAPYPLMGGDAQAWVSHSRQESDDARIPAWRKAR